VPARRPRDELVLYHPDTTQIYTLNETGARFWELLAESSDREGIEAALEAEFDVTSDEVSAEVDRLVAELASLDLVR
jgi:PqqD family protein of HPr-rel-A system